MHIYIYIYTHTHTHTYIHTYISVTSVIYNYAYIHTASNFRAVKKFSAKFAAQLRMMLKLGHFGRKIRKTLEVVKFGAEERRRRSFRPVVSEMKKY